MIQYLSAVLCHCPQHISVWSSLDASPDLVQVRDVGRLIPLCLLHHRWCNFTAPLSIPPSHQSPRKEANPETLSTSQVVLDLGLSAGNCNQLTGMGLLWGLVIFRSICEPPLIPGLPISPNWDISTRFSIKTKLDYLGFRLETFIR